MVHNVFTQYTTFALMVRSRVWSKMVNKHFGIPSNRVAYTRSSKFSRFCQVQILRLDGFVISCKWCYAHWCTPFPSNWCFFGAQQKLDYPTHVFLSVAFEPLSHRGSRPYAQLVSCHENSISITTWKRIGGWHHGIPGVDNTIQRLII